MFLLSEEVQQCNFSSGPLFRPTSFLIFTTKLFGLWPYTGLRTSFIAFWFSTIVSFLLKESEVVRTTLSTRTVRNQINPSKSTFPSSLLPSLTVWSSMQQRSIIQPTYVHCVLDTVFFKSGHSEEWHARNISSTQCSSTSSRKFHKITDEI